MPDDYGYPPRRVIDFLESTLDFFREARGDVGYAPDDNRLVQWWFWYSVYDGELYSTGNLWDAETGRLTELGRAWSRHVARSVLSPGTEALP
jgi:hypothetical protein